jgi:LPXTG-motif cell wall-anchored protein
MRAALRTIFASLLVAVALFAGPTAAHAQERPSDPNGCADTPSAERCHNPGGCADTPAAEHCQNPGGGQGADVLSGGAGRAGTGGGLLSLPKTGAGIVTMLLLAAAAIAAGVGFRRSARRA